MSLKSARFLISQAWIEHVNAVLSAADSRIPVYCEDLNPRAVGHATSGTKRRKSVENSSDPL